MIHILNMRPGLVHRENWSATFTSVVIFEWITPLVGCIHTMRGPHPKGRVNRNTFTACHLTTATKDFGRVSLKPGAVIRGAFTERWELCHLAEMWFLCSLALCWSSASLSQLQLRMSVADGKNHTSLRFLRQTYVKAHQDRGLFQFSIEGTVWPKILYWLALLVGCSSKINQSHAAKGKATPAGYCGQLHHKHTENLTGFYRMCLVFGAQSCSGEIWASSSVADAATMPVVCWPKLSIMHKKASSTWSAMIWGNRLRLLW